MTLKEILNSIVRITGETQYAVIFQLVKLQPTFIFKSENEYFEIDNDLTVKIKIETDSYISLELLNPEGDVKVKYLNHDLDSDIENYDKIDKLIQSLTSDTRTYSQLIKERQYLMEENLDMPVREFKALPEVVEIDKKLESFKENNNESKDENLYKLLGAIDDFPKYGKIMPIKEFIEYCEYGGFIDDDGYGYLALKDKMNSKKALHPSQALIGDYDKRYTHIVWFNR